MTLETHMAERARTLKTIASGILLFTNQINELNETLLIVYSLSKGSRSMPDTRRAAWKVAQKIRASARELEEIAETLENA